MGRNAQLRSLRREWKRQIAESPPPTIEESIHRWIQIGRPIGKIFFELSRPTVQDLRRVAHDLAAKMPDRRFRYGFDEDDDPFIEVQMFR